MMQTKENHNIIKNYIKGNTGPGDLAKGTFYGKQRLKCINKKETCNFPVSVYQKSFVFRR